MYIGIDVAKEHLDVAHILDVEATKAQVVRSRFDNNEAGILALTEAIQALPAVPKSIVLEATGGYESAAAAALTLANLPVAIVNPRQVREYARAEGQLAKTDEIDALILARFGGKIKAKASATAAAMRLTDEQAQELRYTLERRRQIVAMITMEQNRQKQPSIPWKLRSQIAEHITFLKKTLSQTDKELRDQIEKSPIWREKAELLESVPGVGATTATALIAALPELGSLCRQQIATLVGVAPLARDSGKSVRGKRSIWGGRAGVRCSLYMATLVGVRRNATLRAHYQQLLCRGKAKKVALVACMRKLLTVLNAILKNKTPWSEPNHGLTSV